MEEMTDKLTAPNARGYLVKVFDVPLVHMNEIGASNGKTAPISWHTSRRFKP